VLTGPTICLSGLNASTENGLFLGEDKKVVPTNTPPGLRTRLISATALEGEGQQWIAAPA